jgi:hypothetical protein
LEVEPPLALAPTIPAALWSAFSEIDALFRPAGDDTDLHVPIHDSAAATEAVIRPEFTRQYIGGPAVQTPAPDVEPAEGADEVLAQLGALHSLSPSMTWGSSSYAEWQTSRDVAPPASRRTVDARVLGALVQETVQPSGWTLIVTDIELQPPPDWRYIIWDSFPSGAVVSIATLDPAYWREPDRSETHRVRAVKKRARAACISVVGSLIGLHRCSNPECFLFSEVDSLVRLDEMKVVGPEHGVRELTNRGFTPNDDPAAIESTASGGG